MAFQRATGLLLPALRLLVLTLKDEVHVKSFCLLQ